MKLRENVGGSVSVDASLATLDTIVVGRPGDVFDLVSMALNAIIANVTALDCIGLSPVSMVSN